VNLIERKRQDGENCIVRNFIIFFSSNIIRVIKSRRMKWVTHAEHTRKLKMHYKSSVGKCGKTTLET
jgi:hypothetical protein